MVSDAEAAAGVIDGTYDFSVTFPADFSADLASAAHDDPTQATLVLTTNDTNSYLSTTLAKQAAAAVQVAITEQVGESAARTLLDAVDSIRTGLVDASDGAAKIADATATAATGAQSLATGTSTLAAGARSLSSGLSQLDSRRPPFPTRRSRLASGAAPSRPGSRRRPPLARRSRASRARRRR